MRLNDRQQSILDLLKEQKKLGVGELAGRFGVSEMTIRRDLRMLEDQSLLTRTHGGVVNTRKVSFEQFLGERMNVHLDAKRAIARRASQLVEPGDTIILDTGTTVFQLSNALENIPDLTIATPSLAAAANLFGRQTARIIVLGGYLKPWSPDLIGTLTEDNVANLHFRKAFLGADGIDPASGFFCNDLASANVVRQIIKASDKVFVLADSSKIGVKSLIKYAEFGDVDVFVTDGRDPAKARQVGRAVETLIAE
jgi:DeoR/GlpR family transcriptional regulator of sugar metabolism